MFLVFLFGSVVYLTYICLMNDVKHKLVNVQVRLDEERKAVWKQFAETLGMTISQFVRKCVEDRMAGVAPQLFSSPTQPTFVAPSVTEPSLQVEQEDSARQKDWMALSFAQRQEIVKAYRNKKRGLEFDKNLEEYFIHVENAG